MDRAVPTYDAISIQVSLSGYSFKLSGPDGAQQASPWLSPERVFTTPEFQRRYSRVEISLLTPKLTLVPESFLDPGRAREALAQVSRLREGDFVETVPVPAFGATLATPAFLAASSIFWPCSSIPVK